MRGALLAVASVPAGRRTHELDGLPDLAGASAVLADLPVAWRWVTAYWPTQRDRGRAYLHLLDGAGRPVGFVKWAPVGDAGPEREARALTALDGGTPGLRAPRLLAEGRTERSRWLLQEPLPEAGRQPSARATPLPEAALAALSGPVVERAVEELSWWPDLQRRLGGTPAAYRAAWADRRRDPVPTSRAHGDFGPHNVLTTPDGLWVFDWEEYAEDAPAGLDRWSFRLVRDGAEAVLRDATRPDGSRDPGLVLACAFGLARGVGGFPLLVSRWADETGET